LLVRARAPFRISFGGGGTDVPPYCWDRGGAVLNVTINKYAYSSVVNAEGIRIRSVDLDIEEVLPKGKLIYNGGKLDLIKAAINQFSIRNGLSVETYSEMPAGSGMGTSSSLAVSLIASLSEMFGKKIEKHQIAMAAYHVEREELGQLGGYQDQFAAAFGGLNLMEFSREGVNVEPIKVKDDTLEEIQYRLLMFFTGRTRFSSSIHYEMKKRYEMEKERETQVRDEMKKIAYELQSALIEGDLDGFGELMHRNWELKKMMSDSISSEEIDRAYASLLKAGALGGKIQGAGGGGYLIMFTKKDKRAEVLKEGMKMGLEPFSFRFEMSGVRVWKTE